MVENGQEPAKLRLAGYAALIELYDLDVIPNWHRSLVATSGIHRIDSTGEMIEEVYPPKYWPGDTLGDNLEFALKYDGTNLAILASLFQAVQYHRDGNVVRHQVATVDKGLGFFSQLSSFGYVFPENRSGFDVGGMVHVL